VSASQLLPKGSNAFFPEIVFRILPRLTSLRQAAI
jgi:hypothetical protein